ncbi:unnamed protein product [Anisakis simplex]|uniref:NR LBD domain-containing protein n=1 Tax=Anisakis simplex TaxID=6269 RepID=A0A0M3JNM4_ANISI|nr:unnamed protein product [Anisakis simplex]
MNRACCNLEREKEWHKVLMRSRERRFCDKVGALIDHFPEAFEMHWMRLESVMLIEACKWMNIGRGYAQMSMPICPIA